MQSTFNICLTERETCFGFTEAVFISTLLEKLHNIFTKKNSKYTLVCLNKILYVDKQFKLYDKISLCIIFQTFKTDNSNLQRKGVPKQYEVNHKSRRKPMRKVTLFSFLLLSLLFAAQINAQSYGKIISLQEAETTFGKVDVQYAMPTTQLAGFTLQTNNYLMFQVNSGVNVLGDQRKSLLTTGSTFTSADVFHVFSKDVVLSFLKQATEATSYIQMRGKTLTIQNGNTILEFSAECPPFCP